MSNFKTVCTVYLVCTVNDVINPVNSGNLINVVNLL